MWSSPLLAPIRTSIITWLALISGNSLISQHSPIKVFPCHETPCYLCCIPALRMHYMPLEYAARIASKSRALTDPLLKSLMKPPCADMPDEWIAWIAFVSLESRFDVVLVALRCLSSYAALPHCSMCPPLLYYCLAILAKQLPQHCSTHLLLWLAVSYASSALP